MLPREVDTVATRRYLRDFDGETNLDLFLVAAVTAVLVIRFSLAVTGYPQLGGDRLHIAHVLWGGMLMVAALIILLSFLDRAPRRLAALLGGLGFGTFVDEVGKFVTKDNDYFYQPSVAIIYVVLVLVYLTARSLHRRPQPADTEYVANALRGVVEIAAGDLDPLERDRALQDLSRVRTATPLVSGLRELLTGATLVPAVEPGRLRRLQIGLRDRYRAFAVSRWFARVVVAIFAAQLAGRLLRVAVLAGWLPPATDRILRVRLLSAPPLDVDAFGPSQWLQIGSSLVAGIFIAAGIARVFTDHASALRHFQRAVLIAILVTQVFIFYRAEWVGLVELAINLCLLAGLHLAISSEPRRGA
jgi:hypothetical protein